MNEIVAERELLLTATKRIAEGIAATFAPFCEVVVHDLLHPDRAIVALHNNLSGRSIGDPSTARGFARIEDPSYPEVVANYVNTLGDGRSVKCTSIGVKDSRGIYVASLCLNVDLTLFAGLHASLSIFTSTDSSQAPAESLDPDGSRRLRGYVEQFAARCATVPGALSRDQRRELVDELRRAGMLTIRRAVPTLAEVLGVSRTTVYGDLS